MSQWTAAIVWSVPGSCIPGVTLYGVFAGSDSRADAGGCHKRRWRSSTAQRRRRIVRSETITAWLVRR